MEQLLWHIFAGMRGGANRLRIVAELLDEPMNAQQLANRLGVDYRTVRHHLSILSENGLLSRPEGDVYGARIHVSRFLLANIETVREIHSHVMRDTKGLAKAKRTMRGAAGGD